MPAGHVGHGGKSRIAGAVSGIKYAAFIARVAPGVDGLYVTDQNGMMGVFAYDPGVRSVMPADIKPVADAFR